MGFVMDKDAYVKLVEEDIKWLEANTQHSVERMHIIDILKCSICFQYIGKNPLCNKLNCKGNKLK